MVNPLQALSQFGENYELMSYVLPGEIERLVRSQVQDGGQEEFTTD